jgi:hypothetical protein
MLNQITIAIGLLLCATVNARESMVCRLAEREADALKMVHENLSTYDSGNDRINKSLKFLTARKVFQVEIGGDDYALILASSSIQRWPGNNSILAILLNSELRPIACDMLGGEQVFEAAYFQKDKLELVTYSRARPIGTYIQKVKVSATGLTSEKAVYSKDLDLGGFAQFALIHPKAKDAEQAGTGQPATRSESESEGGDKPQPESEGRSR